MAAKLQRAQLWAAAAPGTLQTGGAQSQGGCGCLGGQGDRQQQGLGNVTCGVPQAQQWAHGVDGGKASLKRMLVSLPRGKQEHGCGSGTKTSQRTATTHCFFSAKHLFFLQF